MILNLDPRENDNILAIYALYPVYPVYPGNWCWLLQNDHIIPIYSLHKGYPATEVDFEEVTI